jgi:sec-independent protein translocase protein TatB
MFDISWTEFLLIGVVALVVIGPKELPTVMRTMGQWTRKVRVMAADFQSQFQEAMREAEMADLKKQVDDIAQDVKSYDPLKDVRSDIEAAGSDIQSSLEQSSFEQSSFEQPSLEDGSAPTPLAGEQMDAIATSTGPVTPEEAENSAPELPEPEPSVAAPEGNIVADAIAPATETAAADGNKA